MSNLLTLGDARSRLGRWVDTGSCNQTVIDERINEACIRLLAKADWVHALQTVRIRSNNQIFPLPRECEAIRWANIENNAAVVGHQAYEFLASGPGEVQHRCTTSGFKDLIDAGMSPLMFDIPPIEEFDTDAINCTDRTLNEGWLLMAFSTAVEDLAKTLTLYGTNKLHNDIGTAAGTVFAPGETLAINRWADGVEGVVGGPLSGLKMTTERYRQLMAWKKPQTVGYITMYAVDPDTNYMYFLAKAHPDDTRPTWRRYKISGQAQVNDAANILALVKMKAITLSRADDVLPIQSIPALKLMLIAIREENAGNLQVAMSYELMATKLLDEQLTNYENKSSRPSLVDYESEMAASQINQEII